MTDSGPHITRRKVHQITAETLSPPVATASGKREDFGKNERCRAARNLLRTLIFYDLFGCPVRLSELPQRTIGGLPDAWLADPQAVIEADPLLSRHVRVAKNYVFLQTTPADFERWDAAERTRWQCIDRFEKWVRLFCCIPFVRMMAVTGSLSFPMSPRIPDCDLFVVTAPKRLWIAVTLSRILFLRILPKLGLIKNGEICANYMIDRDTTTERSPDLFDSMQTAAMNAVMGTEVYDQLVAAHRGLEHFFPGWHPPAPLFRNIHRSPPWWIRALLEHALRPLPLDHLNGWLHRHLSPRFTSARRQATEDPALKRILEQLPAGWVRQVFNLSGELFRFRLQEFKAHGSHRLRLLVRYDQSLRKHPAAASMDLAGDREIESKLT